MTPTATALLATYEAAAKSARAAETELRRRMAAEVARLERQRAFAFRRVRLVRELAQHAGAADTPPEKAWLAQRQAVRGAHGTPFYALFDQYFPEVPVVDF